MTKYHINPKTGNPGACNAKVGKCPFGGIELHFRSKEEASAAYEFNRDQFPKYDHINDIVPPKRGGTTESFSDAKNMFLRASKDALLGVREEIGLRESWRNGVRLLEGKCYLCGKPLYDLASGKAIESTDRGDSIEADHIVDPSVGGTISPGNMLAVHRRCNNDRGNRPIEEYLTSVGRESIIPLVRKFQSDNNYSAPSEELVEKRNEQLTQLWDEMLDKVKTLKEFDSDLIKCSHCGMLHPKKSEC